MKIWLRKLVLRWLGLHLVESDLANIDARVEELEQDLVTERMMDDAIEDAFDSKSYVDEENFEDLQRKVESLQEEIEEIQALIKNKKIQFVEKVGA